MYLKQRKKIIIVGGNAAGPSAAAKAKRVDPSADVFLIEAGEFISTGTCELPYVLSGEISNYKNIIFYDPESFESEKGAKVFNFHYVERIDKKGKKIIVKNLRSNTYREFEYDSLILTTGSKPKTLPALHASLKNVFTLKSVSDFLKIKNYLENNSVRNVLIIGGGYIGVESAEAFVKLGCNVTIIEKESLPFPGLEEETRRLVLEELKQNKVEFFGNIDNPKFNLQLDKVVSVNIDGRLLDFDLVLVAVGFIPNADLAVGSGLTIGAFGGIKTDNRLKTSDPNIYAAGDNIEVINRITKQPDYIPLATIAHEFGHVAGENAAGGNNKTEPVIKNIAVKVFDRVLAAVGISSVEAERAKIRFSHRSAVAPNLVKVMPASKKVFGKILYDKATDRILGANFFGGSEVTGYGDLISSLIYSKNSISALAYLNHNYTPPASPFVNILTILGRKAIKNAIL